jgi:hypothetical protein
MSKTMKAYILTVALASALAIVSLGAEGLGAELPAVIVLAVLAAAAGTRSVSLPGLDCRVSPSDVFVFAALAGSAPLAGPIVAFAEVIGTLFSGTKRPTFLRTVFNLSAVPLSAAAGAGVMHLARPLCGSFFLCAPVVVILGAVVCHTVNFVLFLGALALSGQKEAARAAVGAAPWTHLSVVASAVAALGVVAMLQSVGPVGLLLGLAAVPPTLAYVRQKREAAVQIPQHTV